MFGSNPKRTRISRVTGVRGPETVWSRSLEFFKDRGKLLRIGMCLAAIAVLLLMVQSWKAPFPYRAGQRAPHGIAAKLDFDRIDEIATEELRDRAEDEVPLVFHNHPERLDALPQQLRAALGEIAQANTLDELRNLSPEVAAAFGLAPPEPPKGDKPPEPSPAAVFAAADIDARFKEIKQHLGEGEMTTTTQMLIDDIVDDFTRFIAPMRRVGVIDPEDVQEQDITSDRRLRIVQGDDADLEVLLPQVRPIDQINDAGEVGKLWLSYPSLTQLRPALSHWLVMTLQDNSTLQFDHAATTEARAAARDAVEPQKQQFIRGDLLVQPGEVIDEERLNLLWDEYAAAEQRVILPERLIRVGVMFLLMAVLAIVNGYYITHNEPRLRNSLGRLSVYLVAVIVAAALARSLSFFSWPAEVIPLLVVAMLLAVAYNQVLATMTAFTVSVIVTLSATFDLSMFIVMMSSAAMAVIPLTRVASRSKIVVVGVYTALTYLCVSLGLGVIETQSLSRVFENLALLQDSLKGAAMCLAAAYLVAGSLPFFEKAFGVVTDISLLELSDPSHPLLQELVRRAPGTYNHSISVGSIAEAAAEKIGANGLLVRVGAYFHDIGKMLKPQYFIENVQDAGQNRHAHLAPAMSTLIIIGHVKDGIDLAEQHNLPQAIIDFIEQHHGTTLVEYFYHEAARQAECDPDHKSDAEESSFRYPGPKPQTKEAGVMMLADAVESASRALSDPTPRRIETLVHNLTLKRLLDGQFDDSSLTLSEIRTVEESLVKSLIAIYHGRIRYPEAQTA
jgi:putative nucleotidyltransferase with HDIG domain